MEYFYTYEEEEEESVHGLGEEGFRLYEMALFWVCFLFFPFGIFS